MKLRLLLATLVMTATATAAANESADLAISLESGATDVHAGQELDFTVIAENVGPGDASDAHVLASFPPVMAGVRWTCTASGGATCPTSGRGDVDAVVDLPAGGMTVFTSVGTVETAGNTTVEASVAPAAGQSDDDLSNNQATLDETVGAALGEASPGTAAGCSAAGGRSTLFSLALVGALLVARGRRRQPSAELR